MRIQGSNASQLHTPSESQLAAVKRSPAALRWDSSSAAPTQSRTRPPWTCLPGCLWPPGQLSASPENMHLCHQACQLPPLAPAIAHTALDIWWMSVLEEHVRASIDLEAARKLCAPCGSCCSCTCCGTWGTANPALHSPVCRDAGPFSQLLLVAYGFLAGQLSLA